MARLLPIFAEAPEHVYAAEMSGVAVRCRFTWLERTAGWYLDVALPDGTVIVQGRRCGSKRLPLEGLRILHLIGRSEVLLPIAPNGETGIRTAPPAVLLLERPAAAGTASGLSVVAGDVEAVAVPL